MARSRANRSHSAAPKHLPDTAQEVMRAINSLSLDEYILLIPQLFNAFFKESAERHFNALNDQIEKVRQALKQRHEALVENIKPVAEALKRQRVELQVKAVESIQLKDQLAKRNRKSDPAIIVRNAELCRLRTENPTHWTLENLRRRYGLGTIRAVTRIWNQKVKWLRLAEELQRQRDQQVGP
jgi:hypothetical protein